MLGDLVAEIAVGERLKLKASQLLGQLVLAVEEGIIPSPQHDDEGMILSFCFGHYFNDAIAGVKSFVCEAYRLKAVKCQWELSHDFTPEDWEFDDGCIFPKRMR